MKMFETVTVFPPPVFEFRALNLFRASDFEFRILTA